MSDICKFSSTYRLLTRFDDWCDFDRYMKSSRKATLWHMLLEYTNYDWPLSYKLTKKKDIVHYFSRVFCEIMDNRIRIDEECSSADF